MDSEDIKKKKPTENKVSLIRIETFIGLQGGFDASETSFLTMFFKDREMSYEDFFAEIKKMHPEKEGLELKTF